MKSVCDCSFGGSSRAKVEVRHCMVQVRNCKMKVRYIEVSVLVSVNWVGGGGQGNVRSVGMYALRGLKRV